MEQGFFETARPTSLLRRFASVEEVANMIVYVCSTAASATNGAALRVDEGMGYGARDPLIRGARGPKSPHRVGAGLIVPGTAPCLRAMFPGPLGFAE
jgi:hypothetical protein